MHDGADVLNTMRQMDIAGSIRRLEKNRLFRNPKLLLAPQNIKLGNGRSLIITSKKKLSYRLS
jgi:hypothetical protein